MELEWKVKPPLDQIPSKDTHHALQTHPSHTQQFLFVYFSNYVAQCEISWLTAARKHKWVWRSWSESRLKTNHVDQNASKQEIMEK
jgi:hypothetical protein